MIWIELVELHILLAHTIGEFHSVQVENGHYWIFYRKKSIIFNIIHATAVVNSEF